MKRLTLLGLLACCAGCATLGAIGQGAMDELARLANARPVEKVDEKEPDSTPSPSPIVDPGAVKADSTDSTSPSSPSPEDGTFWGSVGELLAALAIGYLIPSKGAIPHAKAGVGAVKKLLGG